MASKSYKIVVIGAGGVGKSCFTIQLISGTFVETYDPTLEDSYRKQMTVEDEEAVLNIYDTAGQEDFSAVRDQYIRIGEGFICMYSITNHGSFTEVNSLHEKLVDITEVEDHPVVLVGNKCDLEEDRAVSKTEAEALAKKLNWVWLEASAKTKNNVVETFQQIVKSIRRYRSNATNDPGTGGGDNHANTGDKTHSKPAPRRGACTLL